MRKNREHIHRGQLQIAETLVSVALMLVLAILLINATNQTLSPYSNLTSLDQSATDILIAADEAGILRPVIYLYDDYNHKADYTYYRNQLDDYISITVSDNIDYALIAHEINNETIDPNYICHIGSPTAIAAIQQSGEGIVANYHLGSFTSAAYGYYFTQFLVQLYLWEKF